MTVAAFTALEKEVLNSIFSETPELRADLKRQVSGAEVRDRENSGAGFFTKIAVAADGPAVNAPGVLGHETQARVRGLEHGLGSFCS